MTAGDTTRLRLRADALDWREVDGEIVALDLRSSTYLGLNRTGAILWTTLARGATRQELLDRLTADFDVAREAAGRDVDEFVASLEAKGLLERM